MKDDVLWHWQHKGWSADAIAAELGTTRSVVLGIVYRARKRGDPRAIQRRPERTLEQRAAQDRALQQRIAQVEEELAALRSKAERRTRRQA